MNNEQKFIWWKKRFFIVTAMAATFLILPLFIFYKYGPTAAIRGNIIIYITWRLLFGYAKWKTNKIDGHTKKRKWWTWTIITTLNGLLIYIFYLIWMEAGTL